MRDSDRPGRGVGASRGWTHQRSNFTIKPLIDGTPSPSFVDQRFFAAGTKQMISPRAPTYCCSRPVGIALEDVPQRARDHYTLGLRDGFGAVDVAREVCDSEGVVGALAHQSFDPPLDVPRSLAHKCYLGQ